MIHIARYLDFNRQTDYNITENSWLTDLKNLAGG